MKPTFKTIDLSYLESIANGNNDILKELINIFVDQVEEFKIGLNTHFNNKSWKELGALAHKAKASVIAMGMADLGNIELKNLELIAKQYRINELSALKIISEKEKKELDFIGAQLNNCVKERKEWIEKNSSFEMIDKIITKINDTCQKALIELKTV